MPLADQSPDVDRGRTARLFGGRTDASRRKMVGRMGPWQLIRLLGEGSMTRVYLARPLQSPEAAPSYAVKVLRKEWWQDPAAIETMRREAWVGRKVNHPCLATVLSAHVNRPPYYLVTPRLVGETLADLLNANRRPALGRVLWIARQTVEALAALFAATGMTHGDIKPSNVMVSADGHATLLDLGFCRTPEEGRAWRDRPVLGTLRYLAPELMTSVGASGPACDLYSLGVTLYETIAGWPPFDAGEASELIDLHLRGKPTPLTSAAPATPRKVASLVHQLMSKDPLRRPASYDQLIDDLTRLEIACFAA